MGAREELTAQMYAVIRGALIVNEQRSFMEQVQEAARGVVDALLADGRWLLVHPDEMIRRDQLEQVGWAVPWSFHAPLSPDEYRFSLSNERERVSNHPNIEPVFRVRPAVEKENDQ